MRKFPKVSDQLDLSDDDIFAPNPFGDRTVNDVVIELVHWFGAEAVQQALKRNAKKRKGRQSLMDAESIAYLAERDALEWLDGFDPFKSRTNYSIAKLMASKNPGQSLESTRRRIMRELAQNRKSWAFGLAMGFSLENHPYTKLLSIENAIAELDERSKLFVMGFIKEQRTKLNNYCEFFGAPDPSMTWDQISERMRNRELKEPDNR
jgi:hypothetical protein